MSITFVQGDTASSVKVTCLDQDGNIIDLTGATVAIHWQINGGVVVTKPMTILNPQAGIVSYQFTAGDLNTFGTMQFKAIITFGNGNILTTPAFQQIDIKKLF